ncbi:MAG: dienelactone hydrolase family protein [Chloroflexota bacterium]|nr:MAG: hydrolase [Chloroflexota bacterium]
MTSQRETHLHEQAVEIPIDALRLQGDLTLPPNASGLVLFAHGSGSSRHSPRNRFVARVLNEARLATLLMDLLSAEEERIDLQTRHLRFDIELLARRLEGALDWIQTQPALKTLRVGLFGSSTGAGAALRAAAARPDEVAAVVSRGGRPDLAGPALAAVRAPTLLIVGENDPVVIRLNREAQAALQAETALTIIPGASHLFEEEGALEQVARHATDWFKRHLQTAR